VSASEHLDEGDYVELGVSDTGHGMTPETQGRVFDPFFTTKASGHGLGLAVVQGIVRSLRGAIRLVSAPGSGTMFQILLPCAEHAVQPAPAEIPRDGEGTLGSKTATILFVEDEELLREAASKMFRNEGFSVIEASDGTEALNLIRAYQNRLDVILLDITLPGISSRVVFEEARRLRPGLPVIVTSANSKETAAAVLANGVERFIRKPYRLRNVVDTILENLPS
jgi:CheY-like chemotaxis protein